ncbi:MAG TPA: hypothetical protein VHN81_02505 [Edaphobacter sp.]|nr:hypothetical protein [Edaphobacter sp.]
MSNRMSVLSRRLRGFAVCFSGITFCFLLYGLYAYADNQGQSLLFAATLASLCFFATFFLWLAQGFAWAMIPDTPAIAKMSAEAVIPAVSVAPSVSMARAEVVTLAEALRPAETLKPQEPMKPVESMKPIEPKRPAKPLRPAEEMKSEEEKLITSQDPPDAKYTITGRRIL